MTATPGEKNWPDDLDAFTRLQLERERTLFMFYGFTSAEDGELGSGYFKLADSLSEALADLHANPGVADEGGYLVRDAFLEMDDGDPRIHVELISVRQIEEAMGGQHGY